MMRCTVIAATAAVVLLSGCGSDDGGSAGANEPGGGGPGAGGGDKGSSVVSAGPKSYDTAAELAVAVGCSGFELDTGEQLYVNELGTCILDGGALYLRVFTDNRQRGQWLKVAKATRAAGIMVKGDRWVIQAVTAEVARKVAGAAGGEVQRRG